MKGTNCILCPKTFSKRCCCYYTIHLITWIVYIRILLNTVFTVQILLFTLSTSHKFSFHKMYNVEICYILLYGCCFISLLSPSVDQNYDFFITANITVIRYAYVSSGTNTLLYSNINFFCEYFISTLL